MTKELYTKTCSDCHKVFRTDKVRKQLCPDCERIHKKQTVQNQNTQHKKEIPKPPKRRGTYNVMPLRRFVELIDRYNSRYGTRYTYGQVMLKLNTGAIRGNEFYA